jgi:hypothetical protein
MITKLHNSAIVVLCLIVNLNLIAQTPIEGTWKGTSICHTKNSACHDEQVVYYISKDSSGKNSFQVKANKIVDGKEDYMGTLNFIYDSIKETFICLDEPRNARWEFQKKGGEMSGKLIYKNELFRIINIKKQN